MRALISFIKKKWFVQSVGIAAVCLMIWYAGPFFGFAKKYPLKPEINRLAAILAAVIIWAVYNLVMRSRSSKKDTELTRKMTETEVEQLEIEEEKKEELKVLRLKFEEALQKLKRSKSKGRRNKHYLYELPWYVIIGAPGCGKTTLLMNSGLNFPLSDYMDVKDGIKGVGGTRNCDWLFTDEAIFLDTAGRYTTQDSHQAVDEAAWQGFLKMIKEYRTRRPINGILLATSIADLLQKNDQQRQQHAREIRHRIQELHDFLGIQIPVYMMFTKCDLIAGFSDFFADLYPQEREQVWGRTFRENELDKVNAFIAGFQDDFEQLVGRLNRKTLNRVHEEPDIKRRSLILDFPRQMALVKPTVMNFIESIFGTSSYEDPFLLRGIYFTSATQEGMPIDRIMGILSKTYGLDEQDVPVYGGEGKSFFIFDLLKKVIFPEAEMAGTDIKVEHRKRWMKFLAYCSVLAVAALIFLGWMFSFFNNKGYINKVDAQIAPYNRISSEAEDWESGLKNLHKKLTVLKSARQVGDNHSMWMGMGLDQRDKINSQIDSSYDKMLKNQLLPVVITRLEQRIAQGTRHYDSSDQKKAGELYDLLKIYLMTVRRTPEEREADLGLASETIGKDWDESFHREGEQFERDYRDHIKDLYRLDLKGLVSLNSALIENAREKLNSEPLFRQIYKQLQSEYLPDKTYDFSLKDIDNIDKVYGESVQSKSIPGLYTATGYNKIFNKQGMSFIEKALQQNWVTEYPLPKGKNDSKALYDQLQRLYLTDYIKHWKEMLEDLTIKSSNNANKVSTILYYLTSPENPLRLLLEAVKTNTSFLADFEEYAEESKYFQKLNDLIKDNGKGETRLDFIVSKLETVRNFLDTAVNEMPDDPKAASREIPKLKPIRSFLRQLPDPLNKQLSTLPASGISISLKFGRKALNEAWKAEVVGPFRETLAGRYPFSKSSSDNASIEDFVQFFKPGGTIDSFIKQYLKPLVDANWREKSKDKIGLSVKTLEQCKKSEKIRKMFFTGGDTPQVTFELKPIKLDASVREFQLNIEGKIIKYSHGRSRFNKFEWPRQDGTSTLMVEWIFKTFDGQEAQQMVEGPWAWFRALDRSGLSRIGEKQFTVTFNAGGHKASYRMNAGSVWNPFGSSELQSFFCPESF